MDINKAWTQLKDKEDLDGKDYSTILQKSKNPILKLKRHLDWFLIVNGLLIILILIGSFEFKAWTIKASIALVLLETVYQCFKIYKLRNEFSNLFNNPKQPIITFLERELQLAKSTIKLVEKRTVVFMPIAYLTGILISIEARGEDANLILEHLLLILKAYSLSLITLPILYFAMKWANSKTIGKTINHLENSLENWKNETSHEY